MDDITVKKIFEVAESYRPMGKPIMTAVEAFDDATDGGVRDGELITISGQSGHGKTAWGLWMTKKIVDSGVPVLWFTYEMNPWYLKEKFVQLGAIEDFATFVPIEHSKNTPEWIKEKILEAKELYACKIVVIDHLHYLIPPDNEQNISLVVGGVVRKLKTLAVETDTIIYLIAHMRKLGQQEKMSIDAVRDSALIINESDYVYLVERVKSKKRREDASSLDDFTNYCRIQLAKNRRTGKLLTKLFTVDRGYFTEQTDAQITEVKGVLDL